MHRAAVPLILVVCVWASAIVFAGCVDKADPGATANDVPDPATDASDADPVARAGDAVVANTPRWLPGDWWRWDVTPRDAPGYEARTGVARVEADQYVVGWGSVDEGLRSQFLHFIPSGLVSKDVAWGAHHEEVRFLEFPLRDGKTWTGGLWLADMTLVASATEVELPNGTSVPGFHVAGTDDEGGITVDLWWATGPELIARLDFYLNDPDTPWVRVDLLEHGRGATDIHVLHGDMHSATFTSLGSALEAGTAPPVLDTMEIGDDVTHVGIGCYLGGAPGHYAFDLTDPDGDASYGCQQDAAPGEEANVLQMDWGPVTSGTWTVSMRTVGAGSVFVELFLVRLEVVTP